MGESIESLYRPSGRYLNPFDSKVVEYRRCRLSTVYGVVLKDGVPGRTSLLAVTPHPHPYAETTRKSVVVSHCKLFFVRCHPFYMS